MTVHVRSTPKKLKGLKPVPFKLFIPRQLDAEQARPVWEALETDKDLILADPFALPGVSTVFPGVLYQRAGLSAATGLKRLAAIIEPMQDAANEEDPLADAWIELWVPDGYEDAVEALDVVDLTQPGQ